MVYKCFPHYEMTGPACMEMITDLAGAIQFQV
jgi:hypothetical protein